MSGLGNFGTIVSNGGVQLDLKGENGIIIEKDPNGAMTIKLDERFRAAAMIGRSGLNTISFDFLDRALGFTDHEVAVQLRLFDPAGLHTTQIDLKTCADIVDFLQGVLARSAAKMMAKTEEPR